MTRLGSLRFAIVALALIAVAAQSDASLKKYSLTIRNVTNSSNGSPNPNVNVVFGRDFSVALIDAAAGPSPVLRKFVRAPDTTTTVPVPALQTGIFVSNNFREGPGVLAQIHGGTLPAFTGTGSVASAVRWGLVTGWTITGSFWCHSNPAVICSFAMGADQATTDPRNNSTFYDLGTWTFHGTGFDGGITFVSSWFTNDPGNTQMWIRGFESRDTTVPVLPLVGSLVLGGTLVLGGVATLARKVRK
jgi:hypothetical protein